ncbi:hypothetical protein BJ741DRAFT_616939 [Chytriomyces cf. hyalinus JEL632]|nr:hypothetical protein BJ741DRAFT_616939 [Chytriomyces cf. hyalinus JEL632]
MASLSCQLLMPAGATPRTNCTLDPEYAPEQLTCTPQATPCESTTATCVPDSFNPDLFTTVTTCVPFDPTHSINLLPIGRHWTNPHPEMPYAQILTYANDACTGTPATLQLTGTGQCFPTLGMNGTFSAIGTDLDNNLYEYRYSDAKCTKEMAVTAETPVSLLEQCTDKRKVTLVQPWTIHVTTYFTTPKDPSQCTDAASISRFTFGHGYGCLATQQSCRAVSFDKANSSSITYCDLGQFKSKDVPMFDDKTTTGFKNRAYILRTTHMDKKCKLAMAFRAATALDACYNSISRDTMVSFKYTLAANGSVAWTSYNGTGCGGAVLDTTYITADGSCSDGETSKLFTLNAGQTKSTSSKSGASSLEIVGAVAAVAAMFALFV